MAIKKSPGAKPASKRVTSTTQKSTRPRKLDQSPEAKKRRANARKEYKANRTQILADARKARKTMTPAERQEAAERRIALHAQKKGINAKKAIADYRAELKALGLKPGAKQEQITAARKKKRDAEKAARQKLMLAKRNARESTMNRVKALRAKVKKSLDALRAAKAKRLEAAKTPEARKKIRDAAAAKAASLRATTKGAIDKARAAFAAKYPPKAPAKKTGGKAPAPKTRIKTGTGTPKTGGVKPTGRRRAAV